MSDMRKVLGKPAGSYSLGLSVPAGRLVFISGQVAIDDHDNVVGDDMTTQAVDVFNKLRLLVNEAGGTIADVIKITAFLTDIGKFAEYAAVREAVFEPHYPASSTVEVSRLIRPDLLVEVEATAVISK